MREKLNKWLIMKSRGLWMENWGFSIATLLITPTNNTQCSVFVTTKRSITRSLVEYGSHRLQSCTGKIRPWLRCRWNTKHNVRKTASLLRLMQPQWSQKTKQLTAWSVGILFHSSILQSHPPHPRFSEN